MNRAERRTARHDLRRNGCTCDPTFEDVPRDEWPTGATAGCMVVHEVGCPLGDAVSNFNRVGIPLGLMTYGSTCKARR